MTDQRLLDHIDNLVRGEGNQMPSKQEVALFEMPELPAEYMEYFEQNSNVAPRETTPMLNPGGKRWTITIDGDSVVLKKPDPENEGEYVPISIFKGFVVAHSTIRGRTYYETGFDEKKPGRPTCWSEDSVTPDQRVPAADRQHKTCNGCPMAAKGSAVADDGRETKACKEHQLLAIMPSERVLTKDFPPLRLKLSITSIYDGKDQAHEEQGWYAWGPYLQHLMAIMPQNCHTSRVETMIKFDTTVNYPKLLFKAKRAPTREEYVALVDIMRERKNQLKTMVESLMPTNIPIPPKAANVDEDEEAPAKPKPQPKPKPADDEDEEAATKPKPKAEETSSPKPKPTRKAAASDEDDDPPAKPKPKPKIDPDEDAEVPQGMRKKKQAAEDEEEEPKPKPKAKPKADDEEPAEKPATKGKGDVRSLLQEWKT